MRSPNPALKKFIISLLKIAAIAIFISSFSIDLGNTLHYGGTDLRTRVVGARLLVNGQDPYYFSWGKGDSDSLLDPLDKPGSRISRVTVPPSVLTLHSAISSYPFINQKIIWLLLEWVSLLIILSIFLEKGNSLYNNFVVLAIGLAFASSYFWRLHVERGQIYIVYTLFLAIAWYLMSIPLKLNHFLSGLIIGFTISLRPLAALIIIPFAIYQKLSVLLGSILGLAIGVSIPFIFSNHLIWNSYFSAITQTRHYISSYGHSINETHSNTQVNLYPKIIEGLDNLTKMKDIPAVNSSLSYLMSRLEINEFNKNLVLILIAVLPIALFFALRLYARKISAKTSLLFGIILYLISDFLIPSPRYSYVDVQWLLPLLIVFCNVDARKFLSIQSAAFLSLGFVLSIGYFAWIPYSLQIGIGLIALSTLYLSLKFIVEDSNHTKAF